MSSILYLKPDFTDKDLTNLINEIIYLDTNPTAYKSKYESIFFKNGILPDEFNMIKIQEKINNII
jgi:hypothetical protein